MLACATRHVIGWLWKQRQDRPHSKAPSSPQAPPYQATTCETGVGERAVDTSWAVTTLPRAAERERDSAFCRPCYTMLTVPRSLVTVCSWTSEPKRLHHTLCRQPCGWKTLGQRCTSRAHRTVCEDVCSSVCTRANDATARPGMWERQVICLLARA
jgi:hypothetical protein